MIKKSSNNRNDDFSRSAAPKAPVFSIIMPLSWRIHAWLVRLKGSLICVKNVLLIVLLIRELKQQRFWATDVSRKWIFCSIGLWFGWNRWVNRLYRRQETQQYKFGSVQAYKKGEGLTSGWRASLKNVFA